jgi:hypothetical protein
MFRRYRWIHLQMAVAVGEAISIGIHRMSIDSSLEPKGHSSRIFRTTYIIDQYLPFTPLIAEWWPLI